VPQDTANSLPVTSSVPPDFPEDQRELFREVLQILQKEQVPFAVAGAFALQRHTGIWRFTKDLDLFLTRENVEHALQVLGDHHYRCEVCDPVWLAKAHRDEFFVDLITGMSNGVIVVEDSWIERAQPAEVVGIEAPILAAEELIASKLFVTRRERFDGADIAHIIYATKGKLEWDRLVAIVGDHWEILLWALVFFRYVYPAYTEYVPFSHWQDFLTRYMTLVSKPDHDAKFRGSLIDDNMFAIDVHEWKMEDILLETRAKRMPKVKEAKAAAESNHG